MQIEVNDHFEKRVRERAMGISIERIKEIFEQWMREWKKKKPRYIKFEDGGNGAIKMYYNDHKFVFKKKEGGIYLLKTYAKRNQLYWSIVKQLKKHEKSFDK